MVLPSLNVIAKALCGDVSGREVLAPGPGHSADDRSMSVRPDASAPDGFLVHSFAGDDAIACKDFVREKLGLETGKAANGKSGDRPWTVISEHIYKDADGSPYLRVRKCFDGRKKQYPQAHWDGAAWINGAPDGPQIPYRLPELIAAPPGVPILIAEGEKCCEALARLGFVATCNPTGADNGKGSKWTPDLNKWFEGRNVVLIPDNDTPGRKHVEHVAKQLTSIAASIKVLDLAEHWPGPDPMPTADDVADFIERFDLAGTRLAKLLKDAPLWQPPAAAEAGASTASDDELIKELAGLSPLAYSKRKKAAATKLGVSVGDLDRLVKLARPKPPEEKDDKQGRGIAFPEIEAAADPVDGAALLDDLTEAIGRHVILAPHARDVVALWIVHTYLLDAFMISPRLAIRSPMKRCGKTTLMDVLARLVLRPLPTANVTGAAMFRVVEAFKPTLMVDEADTFLRDNDELRGIINSGHRKGGSVLRTVGDDHEPRQFATYAAVAIALIGTLPDTLHDRSVVVDLKRRLPSEKIVPFRADRADHLTDLAGRVMRWAADHVISVGAADPEMPPGVVNREADNLRPLLAIADVAGGHWPERARKAAIASREAADDDDNRIIVLLGDIRSIFAARNDDRIPSADLVKALHELEGRPWAEYGRNQKPISANQLARLLKPLAICSGTIRVGDETPKGYYLTAFEEALKRYLPSEGASETPQRHNDGGSETSAAFQSATPDPVVADWKCEKPNNDGHCGGVADRNGENGTLSEKQPWRGRI